MKAQMVKRMVMIQGWAEQIRSWKQSGQTVKQWCGEQGVSIKTFYNHLKIVREEALELIDGNTRLLPIASEETESNAITQQRRKSINGGKTREQALEPEFVALPIPLAKAAPITVRIGGCAVEIMNGAEDSTVEQVLRLVNRL